MSHSFKALYTERVSSSRVRHFFKCSTCGKLMGLDLAEEHIDIRSANFILDCVLSPSENYCVYIPKEFKEPDL